MATRTRDEAETATARRPAATASRRVPEAKVRMQLRFDRKTAERLGVHCSLTRRHESHEVERIVCDYLSRHGRGKELFLQGDDSSAPEDDSPTS
jgi:hypothetical protein